MSTFTLAISCLTTSNLLWFMDLTFQVPTQYCYLQHQTLLLSTATSTAGYCFCFGSTLSFFLKLFLPRSVGTQYATGDQWRNNFRKKEGMEPKQKHHPVVDGTGDRSKVWGCKQQYCIGTWNVGSMNQIGSGQTGDGKSERWHSRKQRTKMDWNGWI